VTVVGTNISDERFASIIRVKLAVLVTADVPGSLILVILMMEAMKVVSYESHTVSYPRRRHSATPTKPMFLILEETKGRLTDRLAVLCCALLCLVVPCCILLCLAVSCCALLCLAVFVCDHFSVTPIPKFLLG
jgi:hypothetical protein